MKSSLFLLLPAVQAFAPAFQSRATRSSPILSMSAVSDGLLAEPHGGVLVDLMTEDVKGAVAKCNKEIQLQPRQLCDVELLMNGGFSPLTGLIMGLPVIFDTDDESLQPGDVALLKDGDREI